VFLVVLTLIMLGYVVAIALCWSSLDPKTREEIDLGARAAADDLVRSLRTLVRAPREPRRAEGKRT